MNMDDTRWDYRCLMNILCYLIIIKLPESTWLTSTLKRLENKNTVAEYDKVFQEWLWRRGDRANDRRWIANSRSLSSSYTRDDLQTLRLLHSGIYMSFVRIMMARPLSALEMTRLFIFIAFWNFLTNFDSLL